MKKNTRENVVIIVLSAFLVALFVIAFATPIKYTDCPATATEHTTTATGYTLNIVRL